MAQSLASLAIDGHLSIIGALDGFGSTSEAQPLIVGALKASAIMVGSRADHEVALSFMAKDGTAPLIDSQYDIAQIDAAFKRMDAGAFDKIVITM